MKINLKKIWIRHYKFIMFGKITNREKSLIKSFVFHSMSLRDYKWIEILKEFSPISE